MSKDKKVEGFPGRHVDRYHIKHHLSSNQVGAPDRNRENTPRQFLTTTNTFPDGNKHQASPHRAGNRQNGNKHNENRDCSNNSNRSNWCSPESKKGSFARPSTSSPISPFKNPHKSPKRIGTAISLPSRTLTELEDDEWAHRNSTTTQLPSRRVSNAVLSPSKASPRKSQTRHVESTPIPRMPDSMEEYEDMTHQEKARLGSTEQVRRKIREQESGGSQDSEKETPPKRKDIQTPEKLRRAQDKLGRSQEKPVRQDSTTNTEARLKDRQATTLPFLEKDPESDSDLDDGVLFPVLDFKPKQVSKDAAKQSKVIATKTKQPLDEIEQFSSDEDLPPAQPPMSPTKISFKNTSVEATGLLFRGDGNKTSASTPMTSPLPPKKSSLFNRTSAAKQIKSPLGNRHFAPIITGDASCSKKMIPTRPTAADLTPRPPPPRQLSVLSISDISDPSSEDEIDKAKGSRKQRKSSEDKSSSFIAKRKRSISNAESKGSEMSKNQSGRDKERANDLKNDTTDWSAKTKVLRMYEFPDVVFLSDEEEAQPVLDAGSVCPYCGDELPSPKPRRLAKALEKILLAEERLRRKKQNERSQKAVAVKVDPKSQSSAPRPPRPRPLKKKAVVVQEPQTPAPRVDAAVWADDTDSEPEAGKISLVDQFEFCRIHVAETTIVPDGLRKNYPISINFDELDARVDRMKEELLDIIEGTVESKYLERVKETYKSLGTMGARQPAVMLATVQDTQPGYYGSKGAERLFEILVRMFIEANILTYDLAQPQRPSEYVQQVLIPEAGLRLIAEDQKKIGLHDVSLEEARAIMAESVEFGAYMHEA